MRARFATLKLLYVNFKYNPLACIFAKDFVFVFVFVLFFLGGGGGKSLFSRRAYQYSHCRLILGWNFAFQYGLGLTIKTV